MNTITVDLKCPRCHLSTKARIDENYYKFLIYTCPKCGSRVAFFDNKLRIISDRLFQKLVNKNKLQYCGDISFKKKKIRYKNDFKEFITKDDILNLKILLETEQDSGSVLSKL